MSEILKFSVGRENFHLRAGNPNTRFKFQYFAHSSQFQPEKKPRKSTEKDDIMKNLSNIPKICQLKMAEIGSNLHILQN